MAPMSTESKQVMPICARQPRQKSYTPRSFSVVRWNEAIQAFAKVAICLTCILQLFQVWIAATSTSINDILHLAINELNIRNGYTLEGNTWNWTTWLQKRDQFTSTGSAGRWLVYQNCLDCRLTQSTSRISRLLQKNIEQRDQFSYINNKSWWIHTVCKPFCLHLPCFKNTMHFWTLRRLAALCLSERAIVPAPTAWIQFSSSWSFISWINPSQKLGLSFWIPSDKEGKSDALFRLGSSSRGGYGGVGVHFLRLSFLCSTGTSTSLGSRWLAGRCRWTRIVSSFLAWYQSYDDNKGACVGRKRWFVAINSDRLSNVKIGNSNQQ